VDQSRRRYNRRNAPTRAAVIAGHKIETGANLVSWEQSANRATKYNIVRGFTVHVFTGSAVKSHNPAPAVRQRSAPLQRLHRLDAFGDPRGVTDRAPRARRPAMTEHHRKREGTAQQQDQTGQSAGFPWQLNGHS